KPRSGSTVRDSGVSARRVVRMELRKLLRRQRTGQSRTHHCSYCQLSSRNF
ncbi:hypothetical protein LSTR_LSTR015681, partial [Laodelphax striatellus]